MTDEKIAGQITKALDKALTRMAPEQRRDDNCCREVVAAYLSGANQMANFLCRLDGEVTSQQMERALLIAGKRLGLNLETVG